jgi:hypothetical protein
MFAGVIVVFSQLRFSSDATAGRGDIELATTPLHTMIGFTTLASSLGGITVCLDVERTMNDNSISSSSFSCRYHCILRRVMAFCVVFLTLIGLLGYAAFRQQTCSVLSLSLDEGPAKKAAEAILVVGPTFESVLNSFQMFVLVSDRFKEFPRLFEPRETKLQFVMLRIVAYVCAAAVAIGVPFFGLVTSINGAFGYGSLAFLVPPAMELKIIWSMEQEENAMLNQANDEQEEEEEEEEGTSSRIHDGVSPSRKWELISILIVGGTIICCGAFATIRLIVRQEEGLEKAGC